jgi:hypothetical protein
MTIKANQIRQFLNTYLEHHKESIYCQNLLSLLPDTDVSLNNNQFYLLMLVIAEKTGKADLLLHLNNVDIIKKMPDYQSIFNYMFDLMVFHEEEKLNSATLCELTEKILQYTFNPLANTLYASYSTEQKLALVDLAISELGEFIDQCFSEASRDEKTFAAKTIGEGLRSGQRFIPVNWMSMTVGDAKWNIKRSTEYKKDQEQRALYGDLKKYLDSIDAADINRQLTIEEYRRYKRIELTKTCLDEVAIGWDFAQPQAAASAAATSIQYGNLLITIFSRARLEKTQMEASISMEHKKSP